MIDPPRVRVCELAINAGKVGDGGRLSSGEASCFVATGSRGTVLAVGPLPTTTKVFELELITATGVSDKVKVSPNLCDVPLRTTPGAATGDPGVISVEIGSLTIMVSDPKENPRLTGVGNGAGVASGTSVAITPPPIFVVSSGKIWLVESLDGGSVVCVTFRVSVGLADCRAGGVSD